MINFLECTIITGHILHHGVLQNNRKSNRYYRCNTHLLHICCLSKWKWRKHMVYFTSHHFRNNTTYAPKKEQILAVTVQNLRVMNILRGHRIWQRETPKISTFKIATLADKECAMWICNNGNNLFLTKQIIIRSLIFSDSGRVPEEKPKNLYN